MLEVILKIISLFLIIGVGYFAGRKGILNRTSNEHISKLVVTITAPCIIFSSFVQTEVDETVMDNLIYIVIGTTIITIATTIASLLYKIKLDKHHPKPDVGVYMSLLTGINITFMGLPVCYALMGDEGVYLIVIASIICTICIYSVSKIQVSYGTGDKLSLKALGKHMLNINIIAAVLGVIAMLVGVTLPNFLLESMETIGEVTVPLAMIVVGLGFSESKVLSVIKNKTLLFTTFLKMIVWPIVIFVVVFFLDLPMEVKAILVITGILPTAVAIGPLAIEAGGNDKLAAEGIMFTTFVSLFTIPIFGLFVTQVFLG